MSSDAQKRTFQTNLLADPKPCLEQIGRLRYLTWKKEGADVASIKNGIWLDDHDEHAMHWVVNINDQIIAAARMCIHAELSQVPDHQYFPVTRGIRSETDLPIAFISKLVVHPDFRGHGIARMIDLARIEKARQLSAGAVLVRIAPHREPALKQLGYIEICDAGTEAALRNLPSRKYFLLRLKNGESRTRFKP